ncbi:MAG: hypothetical protein ABFD77_02755 [Thermotogota bacterium]
MTDRMLLTGDPSSTPQKHGTFAAGDKVLQPDGAPLFESMPTVGTHEMHVDKFRTDSYTEDGSPYRPYKTIAAALTYIRSVAVALQDWSLIIRTGQYTENVVLEDLGLLDSISLVGHGGIVGIVPAAGNSLQSTANNGNLKKLRLINIETTKPIVITGPNGGTGFSDVWLQDCKLNDAITLNCINSFSLMGCYLPVAISCTNVAWFYCDSANWGGTFSFKCDSTADAPSGGFDCTALLNGVYQTGAVTLTKVGTANGVVAVLGGSRINSSSGTIVVPSGWTLQAYNSFIRGNLTNNGTFQQRGAFVEKVFANAGTWTADTKSSMLAYTPSVAGNWTVQPATVQEALDMIAAKVGPV